MRVENVKVTFDIPVHFGQPDKNGYVYTKESWEEAVKKAADIHTPIEIINDDGTRIAVGVTQDIKLVKDGDEFTKDVITNVTLNGIGITK